MLREVKTFEFTCDKCRKVEVVHSHHSRPDLPEDWGYVKVHNCGSTGYTKTLELCNICIVKRRK